jgi:hypothetical protein
MATVFAKLNLRDHKQIVVLDSPSSFESELTALGGVEIIRVWLLWNDGPDNWV